VTVLVWGTLLGVGTLKPMSVHAETDIIPSIRVAERYDTNIYFAPPENIQPGTRLNDIVSTVGPGAQILHKSREVEASLTGRADVNIYAFTRDLNNISVRVRGEANLDNWVNQYVRGAQLRLTESLRYSPESPDFLEGKEGSPVQGDNAFDTGVQGFRSDTLRNTTSIDGAHSVTRDLALRGSYSFFTYRRSNVAEATSGSNFFNVDVHNWAVGPQYKLTPTDGISLLYSAAFITQTRLEGGASSKIENHTHTLGAGYDKTMPNWRFRMGGGATLVQPADEVVPTGFVHLTTNPERVLTLDLDFSRLVKGSTFQTAGVLISNIGRAGVIYRLSERLALLGNVFYAFNESIPKGAAEYNNLGLTATLTYKLTRTIGVEVRYNYYDYKTETPTLDYTVYRNQTWLVLTAEWR